MADNAGVPICKWYLRRTRNSEEMIEVTPGRDLLVGRCKESSYLPRSLLVSRKHCKFKAEGNRLTLTDLKSGNGTYVNKHKIPAEVEVNLKVSDIVGLGVYDDEDEDSVLFEVICSMIDKSPIVESVGDPSTSTDEKFKGSKPFSFDITENLDKDNSVDFEHNAFPDTDEKMNVSSSKLNLLPIKDSFMVSSVVTPLVSECVSDARTSSFKHYENELMNLDKTGRLKAEKEMASGQCVELKCTIKEENVRGEQVNVDVYKKRKSEPDLSVGEMKKLKLSEMTCCSENLRSTSHQITAILNNSCNEGTGKKQTKTMLKCESHGVSDEQVQESQLSYTLDDDVIVISDNEDENNDEVILDDYVNDYIKDEVPECGEEWEESDDDDKSWFLRLSQSLLEETAKGSQCERKLINAKEDICHTNCEVVTENNQGSIESKPNPVHCEDIFTAEEKKSADDIIPYVHSEENLRKGDTGGCDSKDSREHRGANLQSTYCEEATSVAGDKSNTDLTTSHFGSFLEKSDLYPSTECKEPSHLKSSSFLLPAGIPAPGQNMNNARETLPEAQPSSSSSSAVIDSEKINDVVEKHSKTLKHDRKTLICEALPLPAKHFSKYSDKGKSSTKLKFGRLMREEDRELHDNAKKSPACMYSIKEKIMRHEQNIKRNNEGEKSKKQKHGGKTVKVKVVVKDTALERIGSAEKKSNQQIKRADDKTLEPGASKVSEECEIPPKVVKLGKIPMRKIKRVRFAADDVLVTCRYIPVESGNSLQRVQAKDAPLSRSNSTSCEGILDSTLQIICHWNMSWLAEQKNQPFPPPCYGSKHTVYPMLTSFASVEDYKRVLMPLMFLNLWASVSENFEHSGKSDKPGWRHSRNVVFDSLQLFCDMMKLHCHILLTENALRQEDYPFVGDLCQVDIRLTGAQMKAPMTQSESKDHVCWARLFAYVESSSRESYFGRNPHTVSEKPVKKINLVLRIRKISYSKIVQLRLKVILNIRSDLRAFEAVEKLQNNGLCGRILKPSVDNFKLPHVNMSLDRVWQGDLNDTQKYAVLAGAAVCRGSEPGMFLIQGPPGTGKSQVIINMIMEILNVCEKHKKPKKYPRPRVLLCAPSNAAVDEVVQRLLKIRQSLPRENRFKMVRTGHTGSIRESVRCISISELANNTIQRNLMHNKEVLESTQLEIDNLKARKNAYKLTLESARSRGKRADLCEKKLAEVDKKLEDLASISKNSAAISKEVLLDTERRLLSGADIIATTLGSCYNAKMMEVFSSGNEKQLTCCIIDEASQCLEPQSLIPLMFGLNKVVLVGDSEQLPGMVHSRVAMQKSYGQSLFTRLCNNFLAEPKKPYVLLNVQYRMHEEICRWPNAFIYENQLLTDSKLDRTFPLKPYVVLAQNFTQSGETNDGEANLVCQIAKIVKKVCPKSSVGVITPYQKQRRAIKNHIEKSLSENVTVNTVDSFQGQECDVVIFSCTRTHGIGFLSDSNRLNVALTRARYSLIICGNFISLQADRMWKNLLNDAVSRNVYFRLKQQDLSSEMNLYRIILK